MLRKTYNLLLSYDNDKAGRIGTNNAVQRLSNKMNLLIANIPEGQDPGSLTPVQLKEAVDNALTVQEWRTQNGFKN